MENVVKNIVIRQLSYKIKFTYSQKFRFVSYICIAKRSVQMKIVLLSIALVAIAFVLLGVKVLFVKGGKFPSPHVHDNQSLRDKNIHCAHDEK